LSCTEVIIPQVAAVVTTELEKGTAPSILPAMVSLIGKLESGVIVELAL
jgi:hypothetical protein